MVYKLVREGRLEAVRVGRLVRISPKSYEDLLARCGA
ncbi:excisionase family DNA-binding protein [Eggerthellaceae bacterium zg-893]|nr:excisionase family DNA-binding protein [Eggerthellaceae bacterium zg-893]